MTAMLDISAATLFMLIQDLVHLELESTSFWELTDLLI